MLLKSKLLRASAVFVIAVSGLSACGGGSGGGSGSGGSGGGGGGSANRLPTFTTNPTDLVFPENQQVSFTVEVSDADGDTVTVTIGNSADGQFFSLNDSGVVFSTVNFDFENPLDSNGDNVYEQEITLDDGKGTVTRTVSVIIENVSEPAILTSVVTTQSFSFEVLGSAGDIDGDGLDEVIFADGGTFNNETTYGLISGAEYASILLNGGTLDSNTPTLSIFDFGDTSLGNFNLDVLDAPDGSGVDLLFSDFNTSRMYEYRIRTNADRQNMLGVIDLTAAASNRIEYDFTFDPNNFFPGRHNYVGDVDGNGVNDILFEYYESSGQSAPTVGLLFADPITNAASQSVSVSEDVSFSSTPRLDVGTSGRALPDLDSDGGNEIAFKSDDIECVLFSSYLTDATVTSVVLDQLTPTQGICFVGDFEDSTPVERALDFDHDSDGLNTLILRDFPFEIVMDADDFRGLPAMPTRAELDSNGAKIIATKNDAFGGTIVNALSDITQISDLTGDGVKDYVAANGFNASGILNPPFYFVDAIVLTDALNGSDSVFEAGESGLIPIQVESFSFTHAIVETVSTLDPTSDETVLLRSNDISIPLRIDALQTAIEYSDGGGIIIQTE